MPGRLPYNQLLFNGLCNPYPSISRSIIDLCNLRGEGVVAITHRSLRTALLCYNTFPRVMTWICRHSQTSVPQHTR